MNYSYDYSELIEELTNDLEEGLIEIDSELKIVRSNKVIYDNYRPIIDYYYPDNKPDEEFIIMKTKDILAELKYHDEIIKNHIKSLKEMRLAKGLTQQEVADFIGTTKNRICEYEKGVRGLGFERAMQLSDLYKVDPKDILKAIKAREFTTS